LSFRQRVKALERRAEPVPPVIVCFHWPQDGDRYSVGPELFTREEFVARFGGPPEERCTGHITSIATDDHGAGILFSSL